MSLTRRKTEVVFYLGLACLLTHELDAISNHEWRVLPLTSFLSDAAGMNAFVIAHVPLFAVLVGCVASLNLKIRSTAQRVVSGFLVVHAGLHAAFSGHTEYEFDSLLSTTLIYGAALLEGG